MTRRKQRQLAFLLTGLPRLVVGLVVVGLVLLVLWAAGRA